MTPELTTDEKSLIACVRLVRVARKELAMTVEGRRPLPDSCAGLVKHLDDCERDALLAFQDVCRPEKQ